MSYRIKIISFIFVFLISSYGQLLNPDYYTLTQLALIHQTYLMDSEGEIKHTWANEMDVHGASVAYLRKDGLLLRTGRLLPPESFSFGGIYDTVELVDWNGEVEWRFSFYSEGEYALHHDVAPLENGDILVTAWEFIDASEMESMGWQSVEGVEHLWMEKVMQLSPNLEDGSTDIVWEWSVKDHLVQNIDPEGANYGDVGDTPEKVDINYQTVQLGLNSGYLNGDYFHVASIDYNEERDEIILCPNHMNELWIIDHSTTTQEAETSYGGLKGKGGGIIYRWGNPAVYDYGNSVEKPAYLDKAHDARFFYCQETEQWKVTIHNNDSINDQPGLIGDEIYIESEVLEVDLPISSTDGSYVYQDGSYGTSSPTVLYSQDPSNPFFLNRYRGGAQKLRNGNLLLTISNEGRVVEVDTDGEVVWDYSVWDYTPYEEGTLFKAFNYPINYEGLQGDLAYSYEVWRDANIGARASGEPYDDDDGDGWVNVLEYYAGSKPLDRKSGLQIKAEAKSGGETIISLKRQTNLSDVMASVTCSDAFEAWDDILAMPSLGGFESRGADGIETIRWTLNDLSRDKLFTTLSVELLEP